MPRAKKIPPLVLFAVVGTIGALFVYKFRVIVFGVIALLVFKFFPEAETTPTPTPTPSPTPAHDAPLDLSAPTATPIPPPVVHINHDAPLDLSTPSPTPTATPAPPDRNAVLDFIDQYITAGDSDQSLYAQKAFLKFPLFHFFDKFNVDEAAWTAMRNDSTQTPPQRHYERIGAALFDNNGQLDRWIVTVPIQFSLTTNDGTRLEEIAIDRLDVVWLNSQLSIVYGKTLGMRTLSTNGVGVATDNWKDGTVNSSDGSANLRNVDDSGEGDYTVIKVYPSGSHIKYLPENKPWLIVKTDDDLVGFMSASIIQR